MLQKSLFFLATTLCFLIVSKSSLFGKKNNDKDSTYVSSYTDQLVARIYLSQKYTSISVPGNSLNTRFKYKPNTTLNTGVGLTYKTLTLNVGYGPKFLNNYKKERGETKYLDMQGHLYTPKIVFDFYGQFYRGYYITPRNFIPGYPEYYYKPDLRVRLVGTSALYVFNNKKFSHRSGHIQDEWQKKSVGTLLVGADIYYGIIKSDETILPQEIASNYIQGTVQRVRFFNIGPSIGYAYNYVYKKHWFAGASVTVNTAINVVKESTALDNESKISYYPNLFYRMAIGYNSHKWAITASLLNSVLSVNGSKNEGLYFLNTGNYRLTFAHRFSLSKKIKKVIEPPVDRVIELQQSIVTPPEKKD